MGKLEESREYKEFESGYSEEVKELLVLTSESAGGVCLAGKSLWTVSAGFLAIADPETGKLSEQQGNLRWLCEDKDRKNRIHNLEGLKIYRVKCREKLDKTAPDGMSCKWANSYLLIKVLKRGVRHPGLERVLEAYKNDG